MAQSDVVIQGKRVGKFRASILLFKETIRFFRKDTEMLLIPAVGFSFLFFFFGVVAFLLSGTGFFEVLRGEQVPTDPNTYALLFVLYVVSYFVVAWVQAAIAHMVAVRAHGGNTTFSEGIKAATTQWLALLLWSVIASTVGIILKFISDRSRLAGRLVASLLGVGWSLLTYFVVPSIIIGKRSAPHAIKDSSRVFRTMWGETLIVNVSLSFVLVLCFLAYIFIVVGIVAAFQFMPLFIFALPVLVVLGVILLILMQSTFDSILRTLLYIYASEGIVPADFNRELLDQMLARRMDAVEENVAST